ncbi:MAG: acyl carrier protein [Pirellulales bacterium]
MPTAPSDNELKASAAKEEVAASIRRFILEQFPVARSRGIDADDSLLTHGVIDSMGVLEVVTFIEKEFHLTVTDDELLSDHFESISKITDMVVRKLARENATWIS